MQLATDLDDRMVVLDHGEVIADARRTCYCDCRKLSRPFSGPKRQKPQSSLPLH